MLGPQLQHPLRLAAAGTRPYFPVWRREGFRGSQVVHLSARNDARLSRNSDAARICFRQPECDQVLRLRNVFLRLEMFAWRGHSCPRRVAPKIEVEVEQSVTTHGH